MNTIPEDLPSPSPLLGLIEKCEHILTQHRQENSDLYRLVDLKHEQDTTKILTSAAADIIKQGNIIVPKDSDQLALVKPLRGSELKAKIRKSQYEIRQRILAMDADVVPRTQAHNRKNDHGSIEEERDFRTDMVQAQIRVWRNLLPSLIRRFSKIPDYRNVSYVKHRITVLMMFGLFAFIFRLSSRREMNRELTGPVIFSHLKKMSRY